MFRDPREWVYVAAEEENLTRFKLSLSIALMAACVLSVPGWAQDAGGFSQVDPGLVTPQPDDDLPGRESKDPVPAKPPDEIHLEVPEQSTGSFENETVQFAISKVRFTGNTVFDEDQLAPITQTYIGRQITLKDLGQLTRDVAAKYREAGYLTTQVYLPPQSVDDGIVTISVVEGSIGKIVLSGNKAYRSQIIRNQFQFEPGELLNIPDLEQQLNRVNRNQPYRLQAVLSRGDETGQTDIGVEVKEAQPWQIQPSWDNQGRPFIGMQRYGVEVQNDSLLGFGDKLTTRWMGASGTQVGSGSYNVPVHKSGTTLGYGYSFGYVDVNLDIDNPPAIHGYAHNHSLTLSQPLNRSRTLTADAGINFRNITTTLNEDVANRDRIRSFTGGITFNRFDNWGRTYARLQTDVGASLLGGNRPFWKTNAYLTRLVSLPHRNMLILRASGQLSPDALPSAEAFQIGGEYSVRGYTEGLIIGDRGYNLSAEWRWPVPGLSRISPWLGDRIQGVAFYDMGQAFIDSSNPNRRPSNANSSLLMGAGVGVRARLTQYLSGFVDFGAGFPTHHDLEPNGQPDVRVHFGVQSELLPKNYVARSDQKTFILRTTNTSAAPVGPMPPVAQTPAKPKPATKVAAKPARPAGKFSKASPVIAQAGKSKLSGKPGAKTVAKPTLAKGVPGKFMPLSPVALTPSALAAAKAKAAPKLAKSLPVKAIAVPPKNTSPAKKPTPVKIARKPAVKPALKKSIPSQKALAAKAKPKATVSAPIVVAPPRLVPTQPWIEAPKAAVSRPVVVQTASPVRSAQGPRIERPATPIYSAGPVLDRVTGPRPQAPRVETVHASPSRPVAERMSPGMEALRPASGEPISPANPPALGLRNEFSGQQSAR